MAVYTIDKIQYDGDIYNIQDANTSIDSIYDENTQTVTLVVGSLGDADSTEYQYDQSSNYRILFRRYCRCYKI